MCSSMCVCWRRFQLSISFLVPIQKRPLSLNLLCLHFFFFISKFFACSISELFYWFLLPKPTLPGRFRRNQKPAYNPWTFIFFYLFLDTACFYSFLFFFSKRWMSISLSIARYPQKYQLLQKVKLFTFFL